MDMRTTISIRRIIKMILPISAARMITAGMNYVRRLVAWAHVLRVVRGLSPADVAVIRRSALRAPLDMLKDIYCWHEPKLLTDAEINIRGIGLFSIRGGSDDLGHVLPNAHAAIFSVMHKIINRGEVAIDAGANIGAVSVFLAHQVGPQGRVIAVEMMPDTARCLRHNLTLNKLSCVDVVEEALSNMAGQTINAEVSDGFFGQASIAPGSNSGRSVRVVEVRTTTLDTVAEGIDEVAILKMDLEGAEPSALAGAERTLKRTRAVIFESWAGDGGQTAKMLTEAGFNISSIDGRNFLAVRTLSKTGSQS